MTEIEIKPVGWVESPLTERASAPRRGNEGALEALDGTPVLDVKPVI